MQVSCSVVLYEPITLEHNIKHSCNLSICCTQSVNLEFTVVDTENMILSFFFQTALLSINELRMALPLLLSVINELI